MLKLLIFAGVVAVLLAAFVVGRKIKPGELEEEVYPGVKPFIPSEEIAIFGTRKLSPDDYLIPGLPVVPLAEEERDPVIERALEEAGKSLRTGEGEQALIALQQALGQRPGNPDLLQALGDIYRRLNQNEEALACYRRAQAVRPDDIELLLSQAQTQEALDLRLQALLTYRGVLKVNPEIAEAFEAVERLEKLTRHLR